MVHLTYQQRDSLKNVVAIANIRRLSIEEAITFVEEKLGFKMSFGHIAHVKADLKKYSKKKFELLRKDLDLFVDELVLKRIEELENNQRILHRIIEQNDDNPSEQIKAVLALNETGKLLTDYFMSLPNITKMSAAGVNTIFHNNTNTNNNNSTTTTTRTIIPHDPTSNNCKCDRCTDPERRF
jgi:hypothetical protein